MRLTHKLISAFSSGLSRLMLGREYGDYHLSSDRGINGLLVRLNRGLNEETSKMHNETTSRSGEWIANREKEDEASTVL